jgi:hypothetical protein
MPKDNAKLIEIYEDLYDEVVERFDGEILLKNLLLDLINKELVSLWFDEEGDDSDSITETHITDVGIEQNV